MPRPRERVYTLDKQKKHLARLSLLSAKRFRFNRVIYVKNSKGYYPAKPCQTLLCIKFFSSIKHLQAFFEA